MVHCCIKNNVVSCVISIELIVLNSIIIFLVINLVGYEESELVCQQRCCTSLIYFCIVILQFPPESFIF